MAKGYIKAQNDVEIEIVDAKSRADVASIKSQISKFTSPSGELEIAENGTFDVTKYASVLVNVLSGGNTGGGDTGGDIVTPDTGDTSGNTWISLYTVEEHHGTSADGWSMDIPHGLGVVPDWAFVMRTEYNPSTAYVGGWLGLTGVNMVFTNAKTMVAHKQDSPELVSLKDEAASYLHATADVLTCKTPGWGGTLETGAVLMVAVGLNGGAGDA